MSKKKILQNDLDGDLERQFIHIITVLLYIPLIYIFNDAAFEVLILIGFLYIFLILLFVILKKTGNKPVHELIERWGRKNEEYIPLKPTLLLHIGITMTFLLFSVDIVYASIAITALGDGISTISGKWIGRHRLPYSEHKTFEGTFFGTVAAFLGAVMFVSPVQALLGSSGSLLMESLIGRDIRTNSMAKKLIDLFKNDNLLLPIFSGFLMTMIVRII